jgi:ribosomal protein S1
MTRTPLSPGEEVDAVVTTVAPFGVVVRTATGVPGLVRGAAEAVGQVVHLRAVEFDATRQRFSAEPV